MSWIDLLLKAVQYGPSILILGIIAVFAKPLLKWISNVNKNQKITEAKFKECEDNMDNIHKGCHIPIGAIKEMRTDIEALQTQDSEIVIKLTEMNTTLTQTNSMTTKMYNHFVTEGLKGTNRREGD